MTSSLRFYDGADALPELHQFLPLYAEIYAEHPYCEGPQDVRDFAASWPARCERPGHRLVIADVEGERAGFAFGYMLPSTTRWWSGLLDPVDADITYETGARTFAINELAVLVRYRRQGVARWMHQALIPDDVERVALLARPEAPVAQAVYRSWGYRRVGAIIPFEGAPTYDAMLLDLR